MTISTNTQLPVKINLTTNIRSGNEEETFELLAFGQYYEKGNSIYLKYDEVQEEGTVHTIVKLEDERAVILRSGAVKMRLTFQENHDNNGSYESQLGTLLLVTKTEKLVHKQTKDQESSNINGRFHLKYELEMQGSIVGDYEMIIQYKEEAATS